MRYVPGYKGPTLPSPKINTNDPRLVATRPLGPTPTGPKAPIGSTIPLGPAATGPMTPVKGGGMLPQSLAAIAKPGMKKGGSVSSASKRADGCATKGKTKGKII